MRILVFANHKGGVGKTASVSAISAVLAQKGFKVLMVDLDSQANLTLNYLPKVPERTIHDAIIKRRDIPVYEISENLHIVPSTLDMAMIEAEISAMRRREYILNDLLLPLSDRYDYVLVDCPPALGMITTNAMTIADDVYVPMLADGLSMYGLAMMSDFVEQNKELNDSLKISGVFFTRYSNRTIVANTVERTVRGKYGSLVAQTVIHENVKVTEAFISKTDLLTYDAGCKAAQDYMALTDDMINKKM